MNANGRGVFLVAGILLVSAVLGGMYGPSVRATAAGASDAQESIRNFSRVLAIVQQNYAEPVDLDKAIYNGAIPGMLRGLDPHSNFFDQRQFALLREDQHGKYYGVGMQVGPRDGRTVVMAPFVGSPAYKAGIRPGDVILKVDDKATDGLTTTEVADLLKGPKGTVVKITIGREGAEKSLEFVVTRDEIPRHAVDNVLMVQPGIGYVRLTGFNEVTSRELTDALQQLNVATLKGLLLDLRTNPGGLLNEGVAVADMFLDKNQLIVSHRGRASQERRYHAVRGNQGVDVPLVVLMGPFSASASEIVAGAIQDHDRGLIVGENSFGKGLVQTVFQLNENTGLALTTARYYTPSGRLIQRDYKAVSLYDYHYNRKKNAHDSAEVKLTDSGRQVLGGGGIAPDVLVSVPKNNRFQELLLRRDVFYPFEVGVGGFARYFLAQNHQVARDFTAGEQVIQELRRYLDKQSISFTEADLQENLHWIQRKIKRELFVSTFGLTEGFKVALEDDLQVQKAIEVLPQARALYENAKKVIAQRAGGSSVRQ
ncbi:MAG: S41 family peptidase [Acidobacteria bacterium]|nr:S41 family peptidase [Acidobacteriota bacterium]MBI3663701.1 S41 family peptidase [Acidobacteriota bacterium]